jgi:protein-tyrosine phosphatase
MIRVMVVCTGNVCRSPMAEGLLRKMLRDNEQHGEIIVESAGTYAAEGAPASSDSVEVAAAVGVDLRGHAARQVSGRLVGRADLILVMEPEHEDRLLAVYPDAVQKIHLITTFADPAGDPMGIPDPIGQGREVYQRTLRLIDACLRATLPKIVALVAEESESQGPGAEKGQ